MLAVTLQLEPAAQAGLDAERARWSPSGGRSRLALFEYLPDEIEERIRVDLVDAAGPPFPVGIAGVLPTESGVAYAVISPELTARRQDLANVWWPHLTSYDRASYRPHIRLMSEVAPAEARAAITVLRRRFRRYQVRADGFVLWRVGEPWTELATIPFA